MKAVATFDFNVFLRGNGNAWASTAHMLAAAKCAIENAKRHFESVTVYTCSTGAKIFPMFVEAEFVNCLDRVHEDLTTELWCAAKFETYSRQTSPYVHFDLDVFFYEPLPDRILNSALACQCLEGVSGRWYNIKDTLEHYGPLDEWEGVNVWDIKPPNVGFLVMNDLELNEAWCNGFKAFVQKNKEKLNTLPVRPHCCLLEQHLLGVLAEKRAILPAILLDSATSIVGSKYTHLVGNIKTDKFALQKLKPYMTEEVFEAAHILEKLRNERLHSLQHVNG